MPEEADVLVLMTVRFPDALLQRIRAVSPRLRVEVHPASSGDELPAGLLPDEHVGLEPDQLRLGVVVEPAAPGAPLARRAAQHRR